MKKICLVWLLVLAMLLTACGVERPTETQMPTGEGTGETAKPTDSVEITRPQGDSIPPTEPEISYDWKAGESPISQRRIGLLRAGLNHSTATVSETGTYFLYDQGWIMDVTPPSPWILYVDHGSDMVIKLCGRPDCTHDNVDCNAFVAGAERICYYNGYLYVITSQIDWTGSESTCTLLRMNPDGTNREVVYEFADFAREVGSSTASCDFFADGVCIIDTKAMVATGGQITTETTETYYYLLDGSMEKPAVLDLGVPGWICYHCGDVLLTYSPESKNGGKYGSYWDWDPETNEMTFLTDHPGEPGYFGETDAYYFKDGGVCHLNYETGKEEVVIQTNLRGDNYALCLPDCLIIASQNRNGSEQDTKLYIYNWAFQPVETVELTYPFYAFMVSDVIIGETADRIILTDHTGYQKPAYYIKKEELGTGNAKLYPFDLTDMEDLLEAYREHFAGD